MGQALYRAHRPKKLSEVLGQAHITTTLENALKSGKISHAYLFTGPKGVGKTSIARILAHEINELPYEDDAMHLDIIEIDAASNRRIDEIRELRDKVNIAPTSAKYKVYIIDEVHMLTREAFNALLKTLEEPPAHAVFILATTEMHKLPDTIVSRTQRYTFKPVEEQQVTDHLRSLADQEKITISDEALALIARHGEGSFRDSISLLDQVRGYESAIDADFVRALLGIPSDEAIQELMHALAEHDASALVTVLTRMNEQGFTAVHIAKQLAKHLRATVIAGQSVPETLSLLGKLVELPAAYNPEAQLEIILLDYTLAAAPNAPLAAPAPRPTSVAPSPKTPPTPSPKKPEKAPASPETTVSGTNQPLAKAPLAPLAATPTTLSPDIWPQVLISLKQTHTTLYGILRMAQPRFDDDGIELRCGFAFHQKRLSDAKNQQIIIDIIRSLTGQQVAIRCVVEKDLPLAPASTILEPAVGAAAPASANTPLSAISNIFGGGELLE